MQATPEVKVTSIGTAVTPASSHRKIGSRLGRKPQLAIEAIHDIDGNLIFTNGEYNPSLGKSFSSKNITRDVFCSDMGTFFKSDIISRCAARDHYARKYKFETYAIIIPSDYAWHIDSVILAEFFEACFKAKINLNPGQGREQNLIKINTLLENPRFESIKLLVKPNKSPEEMEQMLKAQVDPGTVFEKLEKYHSPELEEKAMHAKWVIDVAVFKAGLLGVKGLALRKFFKINETRFCSFVVTDDKQDEIDAIIAESQRWPNAIVTGICTPKKIEECTIKYYTEKLGSESSSLSTSGTATPTTPASPMKKKSQSVGGNISPEEPFPGIPLRNSSSESASNSPHLKHF